MHVSVRKTILAKALTKAKQKNFKTQCVSRYWEQPKQ